MKPTSLSFSIHKPYSYIITLLRYTVPTLLILSIMQISVAQENQLIEVTGQVKEQDTQNSLSGVTVLIKGTIAGTTTDEKGNFKLRSRLKFPFTLVFTSLGFQSQEFEVKETGSKLSIALVTQTLLGSEVVITASRVEESILKSPVAIEKLDIRAIRESPAPSFYDALENVKGVQMSTSSITFKVPNTRGFNIPNNFRFVQLALELRAAEQHRTVKQR